MSFISAKYSWKTITRQNINRDEADGVEFLERIMYIDPENWIEIDGCAQGKEDYSCRYGYSPKGKDCVVNQFVIADETYSMLIAMAFCVGKFLIFRSLAKYLMPL